MSQEFDKRLFFAGQNCQEEEIKLCLLHGANVNVKNLWGETTLHLAAIKDSDKCCKLLLEAGADIHSIDIFGETPLHNAARNDSDKCCKILLDAGAEIDTLDKNGQTPLHYAAGNDSDKCCKILLDAGAEIDSLDKESWTPLHYAANKDSDDCCTILLDSGASVDSIDSYGKTPLHLAQENDSDKCCRLLLNADAGVNILDKYGCTPLHWAALNGSDKCCRLLLNADAGVNILDKDGKTPLHLAQKNNSDKCCRLLLNADAGVNILDKDGKTPLHLAQKNDSDKCCRLLLNADAGVNILDKYGRTPLHWAALNGSDKCCRLLLNADAGVNILDKDGETPLHKACTHYGNYNNARYYTAVITALIGSGADMSSKDKYGQTAEDKLAPKRRRRVKEVIEEVSRHRKLMAKGSRPVDVVKVFLCGDPSAGKTTIKNTLTKKLSIVSKLKGLLTGAEREDDGDDDEYERTPGIDVSRQTVEGAGNFVIWDCAGQVEYSVTHGMFMGSTQSIFVVIYDLLEILAGNMSISKFWLPFIRATRELEDPPKVVLVATHVDKIQDKKSGPQAARKILGQSKDMFASSLDIDDELIVLDARDKNSEGMEQLKTVLKRQREEITGKEKLPKLCHKIQKMMKPWREEAVPVIDWNEYLKRVRESYVGMDEDTLQAVTAYLHNMGDVYWAKFEGRPDQLILNTQWFTTEIIGMAFAGDQFASQLTLLPNQSFYSLVELREFFTDKMDTTQLLDLLNHMDLVHQTEDGRFLLPGKLPLHGKEVTWNAQEAYAVKGVSIQCAEDIDIFNPSVFPCVQKQILDERKGSTVVSRTAVRCTLDSVDIFVQLAKHKDAINVAVMCKDKESLNAAHDSLERTIELIEDELHERSAGTNLQKRYLSHASLRQSVNLQDIWSFTEDDLVAAERGDGLVRKDPNTRPENVADILFQGYDTTMLKKVGSQCRYDWLPVDSAEACFSRLDVSHKWREDYRSVAKLLGIPDFQMVQILDQSKLHCQSVTSNLIQEWSKKNKTKMTIDMLRTMVNRLGLEDNVGSLQALDDIIESYPGKLKDMRPVAETEVESAFGISEYLLTWRRVLKRKWSIIVADTDPSNLTSHLLYLPLEDCKLLENTDSSDVKQRMENVKIMLLFLLHRAEEDWPNDLLAGLKETRQTPLAHTLQGEYDSVVTEERQNREEKKDRRLSRMEYEIPENLGTESRVNVMLAEDVIVTSGGIAAEGTTTTTGTSTETDVTVEKTQHHSE